MGEYTVDWLGFQLGELSQALWTYRGREAVRMLEIGAYEGRSTVWFLEQILIGPANHLTTVDTWRGSAENEQSEMDAVYRRFTANAARFVAQGRLTVVVSESQPFLAAGVAARRHGFADFGYDIIYIDGSHAAPDVLSDAVLSWALLKPGGTMVFDDYGWQQVPEAHNQPRMAIDSFLACFRGQYDDVHSGYQLAVRKSSDS